MALSKFDLPLPADLAAIKSSRAADELQKLGWKPYVGEQISRVKTEILENLSANEICVLATTTPGGWPVCHGMHYGVIEVENQGPAVIMATEGDTRKLANIKSNPRVSLTAFNTPGFVNRRKAWAAEVEGLAIELEESEQLNQLKKAYMGRAGYWFAKLLDLSKHRWFIVYPVSATWMNNSKRPQRGFVVY